MQKTPFTDENHTASLSSPETVYTQRLHERQTSAEALERQHLAYGNGRLIVFLAGVITGWLAYKETISWWGLIVPIGAFLVLAAQHDKILQRKRRAERAVRFYTQGLRRLQNDWTGSGVAGGRYGDPEHPYVRDLDIFGKGSLYELLCTARTAVGEATLAQWLSAPAAPSVIRARQQAVAELKPELDLREDLAVWGEEARAGIEPTVLTEWGERPVTLPLQSARMIALALAVFNLVGVGAYVAGYGYLALILTVALANFVTRAYRKRVQSAMHAVEKPGRDLALFALLLERMEQARFESPLLRQMWETLNRDGKPASARIARLQRLTELLELRGNLIFSLIDAILLFTFQMSLLIEGWRGENGQHLQEWLTVTGEFEALSSLANYAFERPADPFPEIVEDGLLLEAEALGHPLLPESVAVRNSVAFGPDRRLYIVSGSNMSGKSTFLRTIGANVVLAQAGAPVRAGRMRLAPLQIGASLQTNDSLQAGISRFYAELLRLRQIVELAHEPTPLLFLLDEILHGTNSHDRLIGAEAILRTLASRNAIGLATTHDLALARISDDTTLHAANVHFEDQITDGKMRFDYRLRPGVVEKSNALELMRSLGLDV